MFDCEGCLTSGEARAPRSYSSHPRRAIYFVGLFVYVAELRRARGNQLHLDHILEVVQIFALPEIHEGKYPRLIIADFQCSRLGPYGAYVAYLIRQQEFAGRIRLCTTRHYEKLV